MKIIFHITAVRETKNPSKIYHISFFLAIEFIVGRLMGNKIVRKRENETLTHTLSDMKSLRLSDLRGTLAFKIIIIFLLARVTVKHATI